MTVKSESKPLDSEGDASSAEQRQSEPNATIDANEKSDDGRSGKKESTAFKNYLRIFTFNDRNGWIFNSIAFICMIASGTVLPLVQIVFGRFVTLFNDFTRGDVTPAEYMDNVNRLTLYFVYLFIAKFGLTYIWTLTIATTAIETTKNMRIKLLERTLAQDISYFDSPEFGSISSLVTTSGNFVNQGISEKLGLLVQAVSTFVAAFVVAFIADWKLTLMIIGIVPLNIIVTGICVALDTIIETKITKINSEGSNLAEEVFSSIRNVHSFWAHARLAKKFQLTLDRAEKTGRKRSWIYAILFGTEYFLIYSAYAIAFWRGIRMFASGDVSDPGDIIIVIFSIVIAAQALTIVAPQSIALSKAGAAADDIMKAIERPSQIDSMSPDGLKPESCTGEIELKNVRFSYPSRPDVEVLTGMSLHIPAQKTTALIGASGSGKSTIVGLLERWYDRSSGLVTLDGNDVRDLNVRWLRTRIRVVQQEPTLFSGTIFENIANGLAGTPLADLPYEDKEQLVQEACVAAFADEFISQLPSGYHTQIGEGGGSLSGGQKQRIAIARAIISNPNVLLLDEATSALDPAAEKVVQKALNNVATGRTMIVIAHRLSTIRDADNIVVMHGGNIVEQGTHEELLSRDEKYTKLVKAQDMGQEGRGDEEYTDEEDGDQQQRLDAVRTASHIESRSGDVETGGRASYSLPKCVYLISMEQKRLWGAFFITLVSCVAGGAMFPATAILFSRVVSAFEFRDEEEMTSRGDFYSLMFFVLALGSVVAYGTIGIFCNRIGQAIIKYYRAEIFINILRQPMSFFDKTGNSTGALVSRLSTAPNDMLELFAMNIGLLAIVVVNLVSSCILAIAYGWKLGLVLVFGALPPLVGSGFVRIRLEFKLDNDTTVRFANSAGLASEAVMAIRTVSSLALENEIVAKFRRALKGIAKTSVSSLVWTMLWYSLSQSLSFLSMALGFWYGGRLVSTGEYTATQFYVIFIAILFSGEAAALFIQYGTTLSKVKVATNFVWNLRTTLPAHSEEDDDDDKYDKHSSKDQGKLAEEAEIAKEKMQIQCEQLKFSYPERPHIKVLRGIDAFIGAGKHVAFVGPSGCGKTTMISLLERFYEPSSGRITVDGVRAASIPLRRYRREMALVQQEPVLYQGSIRENVALGSPDDYDVTDDDKILEACAQANIKDFILSLPDGLNTLCGSRGTQFSGGQRQRIAIARALIRRPRLLLLDEATSALDSESEKVVKDAIDKASEADGVTTVAVAHRLSTIRNADCIFVFVRGSVVEQGNQDDLIAQKGVYWEMCRGQALDR